MVYERGVATSTLDLYNKLKSFMTRVPGWQLWCNFDGYSTPDKVYYSTGTSGRNAIYIRQKIAPAVPYIADQVDYYDYDGYGDTGYIIFNSYVNYPQNSSITSGVSEIGTIGPRLIYSAQSSGTGATYSWYHQDFLSQKPGGASHAVYGSVLGEDEPSDNYPDYRCASKRRWTAQQAGPTEGDPYSGRQIITATDGVNSIYVMVTQTYNMKLYKYTLKKSGGQIDSFGLGQTGATLLYNFSGVWTPRYMVYAVDRTTRTPYLYLWGGSSTQAAKYNLATNTLTNIATFSWVSRGNPATTTGMGDCRAACWDGKRYIYIIRGGVYYDAVGGGGNRATPDWARYDTVTNTYRVTTDPEDPAFRGIILSWSGTTGISGRAHLTYLNRNVSGFTYNRLYFAIPGGDAGEGIYYLELGDDGLPVVANPYWSYESRISHWEYYNTGKMMYTREKKVILAPYVMYGINGKYERFPGSTQMIRQNAYWNMSQTPGQKWDIRAMDCHFYPERGENNYDETLYLDGYSCRVRTGIGTNTDYIFVGDADRIIVATKTYPYNNTSGGQQSWSLAYMGAFNSAYDDTPYAELAEDLYAGAHRKVRLTNVIGTFDAMQRYTIVDVKSTGFVKTYNFADQRTRRIANSEVITVFSFDGEYAVVSVKNDYKAGAKIGFDPQPVGLFISEQEKFQVTNVGSRMADDINGCDDPSKQTFTTASNDDTLKNAVLQSIALNQPLTIMECPIMSADSEGNTIARENRGTMKGIYAIGKASGISGEQTVAIGDKAYFVLSLPEYNKYLLIGPIKDA